MPFSDQELALIAAIHNAPGWNDRRAAYANWCKGRGLYDLADLITIQCCSRCFSLSTRGGFISSQTRATSIRATFCASKGR